MAEQITIPTKGDLIAGKYRVNYELGRGAYGVVFLCEQEEIGREVAVKTLLPQAFLQGDVVKRFHREAQLISRLDHPNVIRLFDYGVDEGLLYMTVEYVLGETLADIIENEAPLSLERVLTITHQILDALEHAHTNGIVHRDLKPDNIVILESDAGMSVKVLDFGISKVMLGDDHAAMNTLTQDGTVLGTPHYMSPENIVGDPVDHRADIYALGIIIYEMLAGAHPFDAPSPSAVFVRHLRDEPPLLPAEYQSAPIGAAVFAALEKQPDDRISTAAEFRDVLKKDTAALKAWRKKESKTDNRPKLIALAVAFLLLSILAVSVGAKIWWASDVSNQAAAAIEPKEKDRGKEEAPEELVIDDTEADLIDPLDPELASAMVASDTLMSQALHFALKAADAEGKRLEKKAETPRKKKKTEKKKEKQKDPVEVEDKKPTSVSAKISSSPANAKVFINGVPIGSTPITKSFAHPDTTVTVKFSHIGYKNKTVKFKPSKGKLSVTLDKKRIGLGD